MNAPLQRLRAEIRFDRDAFAKRIEELGGLRLSARSKAQYALAAVALHHAYSVELDAERLEDLRKTILGATPKILVELEAFDAFLALAANADD